ncbi:MAG: hypothetical protein PHE56_08365 [Bacteroidales bacterium]|nr:hypothetical protein [Bacteroidales bacterium]
MDKTIIKLLFGYSGSITSREFRIGISILIMLVGTVSFLNLDAVIINSITRFIPYQPSSIIYLQLAQNYKPNFIPINFILTYSSFILAFKRVRAISDSKVLAIISGITNYLFFTSLLVLVIFIIYLYNMSAYEASLFLQKPNFLYFTIFLIVIGSVNLISLFLINKTNTTENISSNKILDVSNYSLKIGRLILFTLLAGFVIIIFTKVTGSGQNIKFFKTVFRLISLTTLFFYIKYSWYRLRDANISVIWLFISLVIYASIYIVRIWLAKDHPNVLQDYNFIAGILINIFIAAQYSLFLIPSYRTEQ